MYEDLLTRMPLFAELSRRELSWLADACREREYAPGDTLVRQGAGGVGLFLLMEGRVRLTAQADEGYDLDLGHLSVGAIWGETSCSKGCTISVPLPARETGIDDLAW
jgi:CRP-like cAMP-binding protein